MSTDIAVAPGFEVHDVKVVNEVTCEDLGLLENRKCAPMLRAAKKTLQEIAREGGEVRIYWERWSPMTRELIADMILADVVKEKVMTYLGGREECFLRLTDKGRNLLTRIESERVQTTRVA